VELPDPPPSSQPGEIGNVNEVLRECNDIQVPQGTRKQYYQKRTDFFVLVRKLKLWPSRRGILHGVRRFEGHGSFAVIETHCHQSIIIRNSKNSRAARWLRNKWYLEDCQQCRIPRWKLIKYAATVFNRHWGSRLVGDEKGA